MSANRHEQPSSRIGRRHDHLRTIAGIPTLTQGTCIGLSPCLPAAWSGPRWGNDEMVRGTPFQRAFTALVHCAGMVFRARRHLQRNHHCTGQRWSHPLDRTLHNVRLFRPEPEMAGGGSDPGPEPLNTVAPRDFQGPGCRRGFVNATATLDVSWLASATCPKWGKCLD